MSVVVVTGAGRGLGLELTRQFLGRGDDVIATCRDEQGEARLGSTAPAGATLRTVRLDVRDAAQVDDLVRSLDGRAVDVLVNNAGVMAAEAQDVDQVDFDGWLETLSVNVLGPFRVTTALRPNLRRSARPRVVALSSIMSQLSRQSSGHYAYRSSKTALNKVMQLLATDLLPDRIVVCPVNPGWVRTDMGSPQATLSVDESARGLIALIDTLTPEHSGRFWQWDGSELEW